jgi:hypothetical protein
MKHFIPVLSLATLSLLSNAVSAQTPFTNFKQPIAPGQREASVSVELNGININSAKISVVYGTDSVEVVNAFILNKKNPAKFFETPADKKTASGSKAIASVIFPHGNKAANARGKVFSPGTKVFYAWARTSTPAGASGELTLNSVVKSFVMPRVLSIAYLGDSYAAGEGAKGDAWMNEKAHRSYHSGGELAIKKLKADRKDLEIDHINVTSSGATVKDFFLQDQLVEPGKPAIKNDKQLEQVENWLKRKNYDGLDIMLADGGGNDVGFAMVVTDGLFSFFRDVKDNAELKNTVRRQLDQLPETFDLFMDAVESTVNLGRVVWFNYPNAMTGNPLPNGGYDANFCKDDLARVANLADCWTVFENQISQTDWKFVHDEIFAKLNQKIAEAAQRHDWALVDIASKSIRKGICNCEGYFNTLRQSILSQGDFNGTAHPNATGFREIYRDALADQMEASIALFHQDYKEDLKERAIEAAKKKAKAAAALKAKIAKMTEIQQDQSKFNTELKKLKPVDVKIIEAAKPKK